MPKIEGESGYEDLIAELEHLASNIPLDILQKLRNWHHRRGYGCNAHSEGLYCCLDFLLGDFEED